MDVLKALSQGLKNTEDAYSHIADQMLAKNPEPALMGSCLLVMLMKEEDVYMINSSFSSKTRARSLETDLKRIKEETLYDLEVNADLATTNPTLNTCQLTMDHSTSIEEVKTKTIFSNQWFYKV
uniref:Uncharacterized protein n=1 Tax=Lactuca sativa TaxID=4236 RepID=A0A9R1W774_LACSA|nr:hypothetical protein LSAT_V11C300156600 [Lactuca sativa]